MTLYESGNAYIVISERFEPFGSVVGRKWVGSDGWEVPPIMLKTTPNDPD